MTIRHGTVHTSGADIFYVQQGEGPDVVWVPAGDQIHDVYQAQFDALSETYRCTSFDPRGAGQTLVHEAAPWPIEAFAADCAALIEEVCQPPVVVIGLSLGALITQEMCLSYPHLVRLGIPMGTMARKSGYALEWEAAEIAMAAKGVSLPNDFSIIHYAALSYPAEVLGDDQLWARCRPFVAGAYEERDPRLLAAQWQACLDYDSLDRLPACKVPMHVISFDQDLQTPPARGKQVADAAGDGHFHVLEGMGHFSIFGHRPEEVTAKIREILRAYDE